MAQGGKHIIHGTNPQVAWTPAQLLSSISSDILREFGGDWIWATFAEDYCSKAY